jgi:hypothetical protein
MKEYLLSYFGDLNTECYFGIVTDFWFFLEALVLFEFGFAAFKFGNLFTLFDSGLYSI